MEFWVHAGEYDYHYDEDNDYYWLRVKDAGDQSIVKVDDYALSTYHLDRHRFVPGVTFNRYIYVVGRAQIKAGPPNKFHSKHLYRLDTGRLELGWKKLEVQLTKERIQPHIVELDGKLYIFESEENQPLEVYDPVGETITLLPQKTVDTSNYALVGVDRDHKRIVFRARGAVPHLAFYFPYKDDDNKWETKQVLMNLFETMFLGKPTVFAINRQTLYWVDGVHHLVAYNLEHDVISVPLYLGFISNYTSVVSSDLEDNICNLYHMNGDRFCFIWYSEVTEARDDNKMWCTFLNISNAFVDGSFVLAISELATYSYDIPTEDFQILSVNPITLN